MFSLYMVRVQQQQLQQVYIYLFLLNLIRYYKNQLIHCLKYTLQFMKHIQFFVLQDLRQLQQSKSVQNTLSLHDLSLQFELAESQTPSHHIYLAVSSSPYVV
ncbi:unnamed protein product [Paramecium primaurelia]|uniref:Uncharacterized protein n=1 Tax=Paramecium primaurelia TaxID=5886 RepID=A0A8S1JZL6_PARPR|nr:unnamed protein product [Paramecium primaurelia]